MKSLKIEIWSDVVCPWCYIGKRNLETAIASLPEAAEAEIVWHSFQLDPGAPNNSNIPVEQMLSSKYGANAGQVQDMQRNVAAVAARSGLQYHLDGVMVTNTRNAHRLIHWAATLGKSGKLKERLLKANFVDQQRVGDIDTLCALAGEVGLDPAQARAVLESDQFGEAVDQDQAEARRRRINGVPYFLFNGQSGFSGAQAPQTMAQYIRQAIAGNLFPKDGPYDNAVIAGDPN